VSAIIRAGIHGGDGLRPPRRGIAAPQALASPALPCILTTRDMAMIEYSKRSPEPARDGFAGRASYCRSELRWFTQFSASGEVRWPPMALHNILAATEIRNAFMDSIRLLRVARTNGNAN
jgi:hypothetical protein